MDRPPEGAGPVPASLPNETQATPSPREADVLAAAGGGTLLVAVALVVARAPVPATADGILLLAGILLGATGLSVGAWAGWGARARFLVCILAWSLAGWASAMASTPTLFRLIGLLLLVVAFPVAIVVVALARPLLGAVDGALGPLGVHLADPGSSLASGVFAAVALAILLGTPAGLGRRLLAGRQRAGPWRWGFLWASWPTSSPPTSCRAFTRTRSPLGVVEVHPTSDPPTIG